ncbi:hypothetical protein [uncultured Methylobacterium sp.]|uniref:hypothetical protein n=1 Tax=uncultured Methylobacterium sp. TaxID=157278 RepID=UPI0035CB60F8
MQQDTPDIDKAARTIAENVYASFARMATRPAEPLAEQTVLTRLVEAIRPQMGGSAQAIVAAANGALDAWEQQDDAVRGPRVEAVDLRDGAVTMRSVEQG